MNASQADDLIAAVKAQTEAQLEQTAAINRLAESNQTLVDVMLQSVGDEIDATTVSDPHPVYLSGKSVG